MITTSDGRVIEFANFLEAVVCMPFHLAKDWDVFPCVRASAMAGFGSGVPAGARLRFSNTNRMCRWALVIGEVEGCGNTLAVKIDTLRDAMAVRADAFAAGSEIARLCRILAET